MQTLQDKIPYKLPPTLAALKELHICFNCISLQHVQKNYSSNSHRKLTTEHHEWVHVPEIEEVPETSTPGPTEHDQRVHVPVDKAAVRKNSAVNSCSNMKDDDTMSRSLSAQFSSSANLTT